MFIRGNRKFLKTLALTVIFTSLFLLTLASSHLTAKIWASDYGYGSPTTQIINSTVVSTQSTTTLTTSSQGKITPDQTITCTKTITSTATITSTIMSYVTVHVVTSVITYITTSVTNSAELYKGVIITIAIELIGYLLLRKNKKTTYRNLRG